MHNTPYAQRTELSRLTVRAEATVSLGPTRGNATDDPYQRLNNTDRGTFYTLIALPLGGRFQKSADLLFF